MPVHSFNAAVVVAAAAAAGRSGSPGDALLTPPDAVGDAAAELSPAQLANQALLAARRAIVR
jgi:hypothetical protein